MKINLILRRLLLKDTFYIFILIFSFIIAVVKINNNKIPIYKIGVINTTGVVTSYKIEGDKLSLNINSKEKLKCLYYFKTYEEKNENLSKLKEGITIGFSAELSPLENNTILNTFNYKKYLKYNGIFYNCRITKFKIIKDENIFYRIKNYIIKRINSYKKVGDYLHTFILGNKSYMDEAIMQQYKKNGVTHLFAISGMHIGLFSGFIIHVLKKLKVKETKRYIITISFIWIYAFLTAFSASVLRASLLFTLLSINKIFYTEVKTINILLLTGSILILINPFLLVDIGFQYSFMTSFGLIYASTTLKKHKIIGTSLVAFLISLPITINNFYNFNILSIIINIIFVPLISTIIYPLCLMTLLIKPLEPLTGLVIKVLEFINSFLSNISIFRIICPPLSVILILIYYIIFIALVKKHLLKTVIILSILIFLNIYKVSLNSNYYVDFLDVKQGDTALIRLPKRKVILIDTGGEVMRKKDAWQRRKEYKLADNTITYLYSLGVKSISYLILTHGDYDHMGESINLVNNFKVENVIFNCGPYNDLEKELIKVLDKKKIPYYSCIKELNIDKNKLYFLQTKEYDNENDNSNVIYTELNGYKFMFMGDASTTTEKEILSKYNLSNIDVLKVGHHGSKTSSGKEFITEVNPKYSIISVGKNNRYGHPNKEVLENLNNSKIYRTDQDGSIMFKIKNNKLRIETCSP